MQDYVSPYNSKELFSWLWRAYLRKRWVLLSIAIFFMALEGAMMGLMARMMKPMFDQAFLGGSSSVLYWVGIAFFGIFLARACSSIMQRVILTRLSLETVTEIRNDLVDHVMQLDGGFHQSTSPGYLMQRVGGDVDSVNKVWQTLITGAGRDLMAVIALFAAAIAVDWSWTLVALLGAPIVVLPSIALQRFVRKMARRSRDVSAELSVRLNEMFLGIIPIKLNTLEAYQSKRFRKKSKERVQLEVKSAFGQASIPGLIDVMSGFGMMGVVILGGREIIDGTKTVGDFMSFFTAIGLLFDPLRRLAGLSGTWQVAASGIERIRELFDLNTAIAEPADPLPAPQKASPIVFDDIHVAYAESPVLQGVTFEAEAGKTTALVGPSGAGKTTLFNALSRLIDFSSGQIIIGDTPIDRMKLGDLRQQIAIVSQEALLFDETIRENIVLGRTDVSEETLRAVLVDAQLAEFIDALPEGIDTRVGPRGTNLSGGQRQRVAIARAFLRDTPFLLLDEATSALDARSEALVQEALERLSSGRTVLVIAHRLATVRAADKIIVLKEGRVVEEGTHVDLSQQDGLYAELSRLQFVEENDPSKTAEALKRG